MKLLMHSCCAPCSIECVAALREEEIEPTLFWYNPNIHPVTEYRARRDAWTDYAAKEGLETVLRDEYGLRAFVAAVGQNPQERCGYCYETRLEAAAGQAAEGGFDAFCTTLLVSPYQDHARICAIARQAARRHGVEFFYRDFRPRFRQGQTAARQRGIYMQKYCGCVFSEEERYQKPPALARAAR